MLKRVVPLLLLLLASTTLTADRRRSTAPATGWSVPRCAVVHGFPSVALSLDGGRSVLPHEEKTDGLQAYTFGLARLNRPDHLLATTSRSLLRSEDAGCSWSVDGRFSFPQFNYVLVPADGGIWAWSRNAPELFLFDHDGALKTTRIAPVLTPIAFHVNGHQLATADSLGAIWWSDDDGATWRLQSNAPATSSVFAVEFSPQTRNHVIATPIGEGARVSFDGGATWQPSTGLETLNVFQIAFSPVDTNVVWAIALDRFVKGPTKRAIYHSADAGRTFRKVLTSSAEIQMTNGFTLAPSPIDASLLYFALAGTSLYLMDSSGAIHLTSQLPHRDINSVVFSPASPQVLYFGVKLSDMSAQ